ncbi:hypothetical protein QYF36_026337 [Acer negundo]|nr:hypothetical protein QYF36_026337 [Acer negundo]
MPSNNEFNAVSRKGAPFHSFKHSSIGSINFPAHIAVNTFSNSSPGDLNFSPVKYSVPSSSLTNLYSGYDLQSLILFGMPRFPFSNSVLYFWCFPLVLAKGFLVPSQKLLIKLLIGLLVYLPQKVPLKPSQNSSRPSLGCNSQNPTPMPARRKASTGPDHLAQRPLNWACRHV